MPRKILPRIVAVAPSEQPMMLHVRWGNGQESLIDVSGMIQNFRVYAPLRQSPELFREVRVGEHGTDVVWTAEIDMAADTLWRLTQEQAGETMTSDAFRSWRERKAYTLDEAARALGLSRRMVAYYEKGDRPIPRVVALATRALDVAIRSPRRCTIAGDTIQRRRLASSQRIEYTPQGSTLLLTRETLLERLRHHLQASSKVDIAVAWAGDCDALLGLLAFGKCGAPLRSIVGIWGNATHPNALHKLRECGHLRIATNAEGLFHPKFYLFHQHDKRICWIGSANLTRLGFQQNEELVFEFVDEDAQALEWFEKFWESLPADCSATLADYEHNWRPPPPAPLTVAPSEKNRRRARRSVHELGRKLTDWPSFVMAIGEADRYWGKKLNQSQPVIGGDRGWLNTITLGQPVVRKPDWSDLTREDYYLILGHSPYGWLGSMRGAGIANNVFREPTPENLRIRSEIRAALEPVLQANASQFADAACDFIAAVPPHFSGGIATRMLVLARPDRAVSVNNASRRRLAQLTNLPATSLALPPKGRAHSYKDLLRWFENKRWYSYPSPQGIYQRLLADNRAALFDVFVYEE